MMALGIVLVLASAAGWTAAFFFARRADGIERRERLARREIMEAEFLKQVAESNHRNARRVLRLATELVEEERQKRRGWE